MRRSLVAPDNHINTNFLRFLPILEAVKRFGILAGLGLALLALLLPARASADVLPVVVQVQAPDGTHVQVSGEGALSYPRNGRFVRAQSVSVEGDHLIFTGLSLLGGRVKADRLVIPVNGFGDASLSGLRIEGRKPQGLPNQVIPLKDGGYVVSLQESLDGQQRNLAGLVVHLGAKTGKLPAGTEILVGVPAEGRRRCRLHLPACGPGRDHRLPVRPGLDAQRLRRAGQPRL